jgi:hypothetical protein
MTNLTEASAQGAVCPMHEANQAIGLKATGELLLPHHKRAFTQYLPGDSGELELQIFYGYKEISFDEPELFAFGEELAIKTPSLAAAGVHSPCRQHS